LTLRVVVAEDEPPALRHLLSALSTIPDLEVVGTAGSGARAIELAVDLAPDLLILDIQMPGGTGMEVAQALSGPGGPEVMFITAYGGFATDAFELEAVDYLLKPVRDDRLAQAVARVRRRIAGKAALAEPAPCPTAEGAAPNAIWAPVRNGKVRIDAQSIYWIEAAGDYVLIHTGSRSHMIRRFISDLEQVFDPSVLLRVHRSAMINVGRLRAVRRPARGRLSVLLDDEIEVPVGANYVPAVNRLVDQLGV
jgi:two-component system LytT family response regulator